MSTEKAARVLALNFDELKHQFENLTGNEFQIYMAELLKGESVKMVCWWNFCTQPATVIYNIKGKQLAVCQRCFDDENDSDDF